MFNKLSSLFYRLKYKTIWNLNIDGIELYFLGYENWMQELLSVKKGIADKLILKFLPFSHFI